MDTKEVKTSGALEINAEEAVMNKRELKILESTFLDRVNFKIRVINDFCASEDQSSLSPTKSDKRKNARQ